MSEWSLEIGEVVEVLRGFNDNSFDALACDSPYGYNFMGKAWDYDVPSVDLWRECLRVLKPGAPLATFAGARTCHRMACNVEDAGFWLFDQLEWLYAKGYPKSLPIDRAISVDRCTLPGRHYMSTLPAEKKRRPGDHVCPDHADGAPWRGYGTGLKPAHEPIVLAVKPRSGTYVENVDAWGVGALAIDACRIPRGDKASWPANVILSHSEDCRPTGQIREIKNATAVRHRGVVAGTGATFGIAKPVGTPDMSYGVQEIEVWECTDDCPIRLLDAEGTHTKSVPFGMGPNRDIDNVASGTVLPLSKRTAGGYTDSGGPSRFYYCAKVSRSEREAGCEDLPLKSAGECTDREDESAGLQNPRAGAGRTKGFRNHHPTLKPISLTTWLARLIMPPAPGVILVPFAGAGSEMIGALKAGWSGVFGIEREAEYAAIARARLAHWCKESEAA